LSTTSSRRSAGPICDSGSGARFVMGGSESKGIRARVDKPQVLIACSAVELRRHEEPATGIEPVTLLGLRVGLVRLGARKGACPSVRSDVGRESNPLPTAYKADALPMSYRACELCAVGHAKILRARVK